MMDMNASEQAWRHGGRAQNKSQSPLRFTATPAVAGMRACGRGKLGHDHCIGRGAYQTQKEVRKEDEELAGVVLQAGHEVDDDARHAARHRATAKWHKAQAG